MQVLIGAVRYDVVQVAELASASGELHGDINYRKCRIRIDADDHPQIQRVTLWHEILHGILNNAAYTEKHDETVIDALAHGIIQVLRDNPTLRG